CRRLSMITPITRVPNPTQDRCAACGALLTSGYFYLRDRIERYCPACIASRPRCDACSAPVGDQHWMLHDGRVLCARCHSTAIYVLYGLPKLTFRTVVAHEYTHAWQGETCPLLADDGLREGFAEWVAYRHLLFLGCTKAAQHMLTSAHPYRPLLEHVLTLEQQV